MSALAGRLLIGTPETLAGLDGRRTLGGNFAHWLGAPLVRHGGREWLGLDPGGLGLGGVGFSLGIGCGLCFRRRGDIGRLPTATRRSAGIDSFGSRGRWRRGRDDAAPASRSGRGRRLLLSRALLTLPARTQPRHLIIRQLTQVAPYGNVHLTKQTHQLVAGHAKFTGEIVHAQLDQPYLPVGLARAPSTIARMPRAKSRSTTPTAAVESRPTAPPSCVAAGP